MTHLRKVLRICMIVALPVLISSCGKPLSRDDAATLISGSNNFQRLRSSIPFRNQWDQTAHNEGVIAGYSGRYCSIADQRLLALLKDSNCSTFTAELRQPVSTPTIVVTGLTDAVLPSNSAKIKEVQFTWTYNSVPGPLNRFIISGGIGKALIRLYDDGWRLENLDLSPSTNAPYILSESEKKEAQQQMAMRQEELNREAEQARIEAERVRAEQERVAVVIKNSQINSAQPIAAFNVLLGGSSFTKGNKPEIGQFVVGDAGLQFPAVRGRTDANYLWFGNLFAIAKQGSRQTRPGFVTNEDYPAISVQVRDGKNGTSGSSLAMFTYRGPVFEDDATRDRFYATVVEAFNKWRSRFPEAY